MAKTSSNTETGQAPSTESPSSEVELSPAWEAWVVDNLLDAVPLETLAATLQEQGVPQEVAQNEIMRIRNSAAFQRAMAFKKSSAQFQQITQLHRELRHNNRSEVGIPREKPMGGEVFFQNYYTQNQPVVLEGLAKDWPALSRWTPDYLTQLLGDEEVEVTADRESDPDYDANFKGHSVTMTMTDFLQRVQAVGTSNDIYMTANNRMMERPAFQRLIEDVCPPLEYVRDGHFAGGTSLWIGPQGTQTPLHHDNTNIIFCQLVGRKEFHLASPLETHMLKWATRTFYNEASFNPMDLDRFPELAQVQIETLILEPGDALFIPVGWWHQVQSLDFSISLSFINLLRPNRFDGYHPGK
ncbi:MAG: hypothetical protein CMH56_04940 [Myxococcales bacterium]|nr:hypothetical protein [Myxococcales bacterium]